MTSKSDNPAAAGKLAIKKRSKVPGVMITQFVENLPQGMSTPDFTRKPIALTIQEGKTAIFRSIVTGNPSPNVTWTRSKGDLSDGDRFKIIYETISGEYQLQMPDVGVDQAGTYKCFAENEYGKAVVTATLNIIEVGFKKGKALQESRTAIRENVADFKNLLKTRGERQKEDRLPGEPDEHFWELLLSADRKDYERICAEYGVTDFRWMLKKLNEKKREREEEQAQFVEHLSNLKPIEIKTPGCAEFEFEMELKDQNSRIFLYKNGQMIPFTLDTGEKHSLKQIGRKFVFSVKDLDPEDAGLYQVDVEGVNVFSTDFKIPSVDFLVKIQEVKAIEREDAVFECVLSNPMPQITWLGKNVPLQQGEKHDITVSEDKLIHRLVVKDCLQLDKGIYTAVVGIKSCNAWLVVEADNDPSTHGKKKARKTTQAGGGGADLAKIAAEQNAKIQKAREEMLEKMRQERAEMVAAMAENGEEAVAEAVTANQDAVRPRQLKPASAPKDLQAEPEVKQAVVETKQEIKECGDGDAGEDISVPELEEETTADVQEGEKKKRVRNGPLVPDTVIDPGVHFTRGLEDVKAIIGCTAELICKLSKENIDGVWYKDGEELSSSEDVSLVRDGAFHKLVIRNCKEEDSGKYRFEADGRKTEAMLTVEDPPRINPDDLAKFSEPVIIKTGQNASFQLSFVGQEPLKIQWYNEDEEVLIDNHVRIEKSSTQSRLILTKCVRKQSGEIKIKIKNVFGTIEATTKLTVLDKPTPPQNPVEIVEASSHCVEIKWRAPKDNGGSPIINYNLERQQLGRNTWKKIGMIPGIPHYKDTDVDHGRKYCYRIRAVTAEGTSEVMETDDIQAGTKAYPGPPSAPKVVSAFKDCINLSWTPPANTGGTNIVGYNLEKRKRGSNLWGPVNPPEEPIKAKQVAVKDVVEGIEYEFRVSAINFSGAGEPSPPSEFVFARDPKKPPGKVIDLKVTDSTYTSLSLGWTKPKEEKGVQDEAKGYCVEIRPAESLEWERCNLNVITMTSYTILGLKSMAMYWVRVIAINEGGPGLSRDLDNYIIAMPPPVRPNFTDRKLKTFLVIRAGNSARVNINFVASPLPTITWLKDGMAVSKRVTISNTEGSSQLLIPSSERLDTGVYSIVVSNLVGQETCSIEIRVTDDPKPPGPVELEQNVPGTVTLSWTPSPDEKRDDRLHYMVAKRDSVKQTWRTVADHLYNNKFTVANILPGREFLFRVYAKNDMGVSEPTESNKWEVVCKKEKFILTLPESKNCKFEAAPSFLLPLKKHSNPPGYECYMSCAVKGDPAPHITWYRDNVSLNTNTNYYISNTCGVCSLLILRVGPKDTGEYKVVAESPLGRAECSTTLTVRE
ncbi:immunoglobulin-like and fibronectin type III domain-containing protein 1 [Denticeps clupeoides]|uniref:immunoglobulin-like and fibronectin type III domain-containing protein 1 n=1 Tax=Denticeps clupeoides TaxID=299321 RepID=UPI0010A428F1|nr:immunoglobulin-like and fibronectin type III domain-containing protein 1 [Denticeps clupeoides]